MRFLTPDEGSSPLTRGKPPGGPRAGGACRLIPAHAGKTRRQRSPAGVIGAHPRSRGENDILNATGFRLTGSSPLTRGKRLGEDLGGFGGGLIPAHAGKTGKRL